MRKWYLLAVEQEKEAAQEASVLVRMAGVIEHRNDFHLGSRGCRHSQGQHGIHRNGEMYKGCLGVQDLSYVPFRWTGRSQSCPLVVRDCSGKTTKPEIYGMENSDKGIVVRKSANKERSAEQMERRPLTKGKLQESIKTSSNGRTRGRRARWGGSR